MIPLAATPPRPVWQLPWVTRGHRGCDLLPRLLRVVRVVQMRQVAQVVQLRQAMQVCHLLKQPVWAAVGAEKLAGLA